MDPRQRRHPRARELAAGQRQRARRGARLRAPRPRGRRHLRARLDVQGVHRRRRARGRQGHAGHDVQPPAGAPVRRPRDRRRRRTAATVHADDARDPQAVLEHRRRDDRPARSATTRFDSVGPPLRLRQADRRRPAGRGAGHRAARSTDYSGSTMGNLPIGQGLAVTPMQMAAAYSRDRQRRHPAPAAHRRRRRRRERKPTPKGQRVISEATAASRAQDARGRARPGRHGVRRGDRGLRARRQDRHGARSRSRTAATRRTSTSRRSSASRPPSTRSCSSP